MWFLRFAVCGLWSVVLLSAESKVDEVPASGMKAGIERPVRVAVVDLHRLLNESQLRQEVNQNIEKEAEKKTSEFASMGKEIEKLKGEIEQYAEASPERREKGKELAIKISRMEALEKWEKRAFNERLNAAYVKVYDSVRNLIEGYAKREGYDLVLRHDRQPIVGESRNEILSQIYARAVLYFVPSIDITDEILKEVNR